MSPNLPPSPRRKIWVKNYWKGTKNLFLSSAAESSLCACNFVQESTKEKLHAIVMCSLALKLKTNTHSNYKIITHWVRSTRGFPDIRRRSDFFLLIFHSYCRPLAPPNAVPGWPTVPKEQQFSRHLELQKREASKSCFADRNPCHPLKSSIGCNSFLMGGKTCRFF